MSLTSKRRFWEALRALGYANYDEYLASDHWRDLRARYYGSKLYTHRCFCCGGEGPFHLHHRTYKRLGREWLMDLVTVCSDCHLEAHQLDETSTRMNLWAATKRIRSLHAGDRRRLSGAHRPLAGTVRAVRRSTDRKHVS